MGRDKLTRFQRLEIAALALSGLGAAAAAIGLVVQSTEIAETRRVNEHVLEGLAYERLERIRGTGIEATRDWSGEVLTDAGISPGRWSLERLLIALREIRLEQTGGGQHSEVSLQCVALDIRGIGPSDFSRSTIQDSTIAGTTETQDFSASFIAGSKFIAPSIGGWSFANASFLAPWDGSGTLVAVGTDEIFMPFLEDRRAEFMKERSADFRGVTFFNIIPDQAWLDQHCYDDRTVFVWVVENVPPGMAVPEPSSDLTGNAAGQVIFEPAITDQVEARCRAHDDSAAASGRRRTAPIYGARGPSFFQSDLGKQQRPGCLGTSDD